MEKFSSADWTTQGVNETYTPPPTPEMIENLTRFLGLNNEGRFNVDRGDLEAILEHKGAILVCSGSASGKDAAALAITQALESALLENLSAFCLEAKGVIVYFECSEDYPALELESAMEMLGKLFDNDECEIIWGLRYINGVSDEYMSVKIIATGFETYPYEKIAQ